jgi:hypothetical protein
MGGWGREWRGAAYCFSLGHLETLDERGDERRGRGAWLCAQLMEGGVSSVDCGGRCERGVQLPSERVRERERKSGGCDRETPRESLSLAGRGRGRGTHSCWYSRMGILMRESNG